MEREQNKILIVEDDAEIAALLELHISDRGIQVTRVDNGKDGLEAALRDDFSLIILDLMLPLMDGMEVCKRIRAQDKAVPILMLTARSEEIDKILGLELGADDYLTKPFSIRELLARINALLRRSSLVSASADEPDEILTFGSLQVDMQRRRALLRDAVLDLTAKEWDLLVLFARNPGRTYSRQELLDLVWGYQYDGYSHTVNSHINRLRSKIEVDPARPEYVLTKRGLGYRFVDPSVKEEATI